MAKIKWRKWNRAIHRDLGYFFFAMSVIYGLSGIAVNHLHDWNPNYQITYNELTANLPADRSALNKSAILSWLEEIGEKDNYKKHYYPNKNTLKIFLDGGNIQVDLTSGHAYIEKIRRRPILHAVNFLHYNPGKWWTTFSDIYAIALILLAVTGLFILKGKNGITRRGAWLTAAGIIIPVLYLIMFY
ncbi:MAG: PepSY-associated TM helix domain-containing protein [Bacteroidales bacterium]